MKPNPFFSATNSTFEEIKIDPQYIPLLLAEIKKIVFANNAKNRPRQQSAYIVMADILQRAETEYEETGAYSPNLIHSLDQFIFSLIHYNEAFLLRQLAGHREFFIAHLKNIKPYRYVFYSLGNYLDVFLHAFAEDAVDTIDFLRELGWQYTEDHLEVAIVNHARNAVRYILMKYPMNIDHRQLLAESVAAEGDVTMLNLLLPEQPFFYFEEINVKLKSLTKISFRLVLNAVSKAYRYSDMQDVDRLCIKFIGYIKKQYNENKEGVLTIKQAFYHARKLFPEWAHIPLYHRKSDARSLKNSYHSDMSVSREMYQGLEESIFVNSLLTNKEKKDTYSWDYFLKVITAYRSKEAKNLGYDDYHAFSIIRTDEERKSIHYTPCGQRYDRHHHFIEEEFKRTRHKDKLTLGKSYNILFKRIALGSVEVSLDQNHKNFLYLYVWRHGYCEVLKKIPQKYKMHYRY